ncbi:MAG: MarR family transcriptional regulator [Flavobacteriales bacterium]|nr:MarR family transcriptional regulator [Flavobacteriales bacterium]|tara:strand:+ start:168 stop:629 length:462 start_codon:yes stop_codon:yes gene_type:complete
MSYKEQQIYKLRRLSQKYAYTSIQMHETIGRKAGLSGTDHKYLGFIIQKGQMTAGELAILTGLTTGAVTSLVDRFEKKDLVRRELDKNDRRKIIIIPNTKKITSILEPLYREFQSDTDNLMASFTSEELKLLETYFQKYLKLMDDTINNLNAI